MVANNTSLNLVVREVLDLSVALDPALPCSWPGLPPFAARPTLGTDPPDPLFVSRSLTVEEHSGTHADAPVHMALDETGRRLGALDTVPLRDLTGRPRVIDARSVRGDVPGESPWVTPEVLLAYEASTEAIRPGDVVLFWTGWSDEFYAPGPGGQRYMDGPINAATPGWPAPSASCLELLADRGVKVVGVDTPSLGAVHDPVGPHRAAFLGRITPLENLTNLGAVRDAAGLFVFLPISAHGATGGPGRATVLVMDESR